MRAHRLADRFWLSAALAAPNDGAALVDDADRGGLKRHIKADVVLLIHGNASERWLPAEATRQSAPNARRDYAMSRPVEGQSTARKRRPGCRVAAPARCAGAQRPGQREHGAMLTTVGEDSVYLMSPSRYLHIRPDKT
jgi:hypothetical protein